MLAFANYNVATVKEELGFKQTRNRALGAGTRVLHTQERPGWVAKSRYPLPDTMQLNYEAFSTALAAAMEQQDKQKEVTK